MLVQDFIDRNNPHKVFSKKWVSENFYLVEVNKQLKEKNDKIKRLEAELSDIREKFFEFFIHFDTV